MQHSKSISLFAIIFFCLSIGAANAQSSARFGIAKFGNGKGDSLNYRLLFPDYDTLRKYPLVIFLHGSGERGNDNEAQLKWGVGNFGSDQMMMAHPAIVIAPQCPAGMSWGNYGEHDMDRDLHLLLAPSKPMELVIELIHKLIKTMPIDTNRIYITGLSMGGKGTFDAIERWPHLFAAAVPVCGAGDVSKAASIAHIPIWIFHGAEDASIDALCSVDMHAALVKAGAHPGLTIYPAVGHFSWLAAYSDPLMYEWLFKQHK